MRKESFNQLLYNLEKELNLPKGLRASERQAEALSGAYQEVLSKYSKDKKRMTQQLRLAMYLSIQAILRDWIIER